ncbi:MAG: DUF3570 domain-containing protein [Candidatus Eisenbacteria bacterium]|uniref:DUF3570 domain-containing protein n=1 Tax=Eiseniibacteriota bacterium TaxID=2212470 RepID=A0A538UB52_UNCEI|nr:MAG: DUF3570 domain-containing protein [Candidatus Eisenbacteria bacterium]
MQLRTQTAGLAVAAVLAAFVSTTARAGMAFDEQTLGPLFRYFSDSDHVGVRSVMGDYAFTLPSQVGLSLHWNNEQVTIPAIRAPVGSQEAVDAITTASRPIAGNAFQDFVKVRNEFQGELSRGGAGLAYYYSTESDYFAHQLAGHYDLDLVHQQLDLSLGSSYGWDDIEPLADDRSPTAASTKTTLHVDAVATQVVSPRTMIRYGLEYNVVDGLQHNPYRHVYAGGTNVPERHPDHRARRDAFVKLNRWFENRSSVRLSYRLYDDDWGIVSHELSSKLSQYVTQGMFVRWQYRYYTQTPAYFYRDEYLSTSGVDGYLSGDYRVGPLAAHLFGVALHFDLGILAANAPYLDRTGLTVGYERYFNRNNYSADILETAVEFTF